MAATPTIAAGSTGALSLYLTSPDGTLTAGKWRIRLGAEIIVAYGSYGGSSGLGGATDITGTLGTPNEDGWLVSVIATYGTTCMVSVSVPTGASAAHYTLSVLPSNQYKGGFAIAAAGGGGSGATAASGSLRRRGSQMLT